MMLRSYYDTILNNRTFLWRFIFSLFLIFYDDLETSFPLVVNFYLFVYRKSFPFLLNENLFNRFQISKASSLGFFRKRHTLRDYITCKDRTLLRDQTWQTSLCAAWPTKQVSQGAPWLNFSLFLVFSRLRENRENVLSIIGWLSQDDCKLFNFNCRVKLSFDSSVIVECALAVTLRSFSLSQQQRNCKAYSRKS